ncbi:MAG: TAT-variant-translocated molybdopterin oxidoreductase, partial [Alphaproteobacteria bacterium]|nr:TAT-variant-translocated molybdopterin oxidoreductase [Alphaproteobacteria bacterium]
MSARASRFDPARIRAVSAHGARRFWSSLDELIDEEGFRAWLSAEFPSAASLFDVPGRRQFLKLMGASLLLSGLSACDEERAEHARPYVVQPENETPGVPRDYATAVTFEGYAQPVIARTYAGRPVKLDGNPDHPATQGASDAFMQASIFGLYDPERAKAPTRDGGPTTWDAFEAALMPLRARWAERRGEGLRILTGATTSPTLIRQLSDLAKTYPAMRWHRFEPAGQAPQDAAMRLAFGRVVQPHYRLDQCEAIVSLGHDFLGPGPHQVANAAAWAQRRGEHAPGQGRSRLHVAEALPSLTGTVASTRLSCDPSRIAALATALAAQFGLAGWTAPALHDHEQQWLTRAAADLRSHGGRALLLVGPWLDPQLQALAPAINAQLKNPVAYSDPIHAVPDETQSLDALARDMQAGAVETLIAIDCNPLYAAPGAMQFVKHFARVANRIHAGLHADETALASQWHVPLSHALESWSDARAVDGRATIIQPVIAPLYATRSVHQLIDLLAANGGTSDSAVRATWQAALGDGFADKWTRALTDGAVDGSAAKPLTLAPQAVPPPQPGSESGDTEIVLTPDPTVWDGRFANIAWLQELPKPISKITWDNVVAISPALAGAKNLSNGDIVELAIGEQHVRGPVFIMPGQAANTVHLTFGYGRRAGGDIAFGSGYDAFALQPAEHAFMARGTIARIDGRHQLATTQAHHRMDGFDFVREVSAANPRTPPPKQNTTLYPDWNVKDPGSENIPDHAWGMVIDLDLCIGCNACIAACNVENNVLVVGKDQVSRGREMIWLRVDRYYTGEPDNPRSYFQPVPCMHCEKAPCEMGCPVHATVHSPEGVNQMVYNRCIGTRTCSSYCPYKVRRFNWYDFRKFGEVERA